MTLGIRCVPNYFFEQEFGRNKENKSISHTGDHLTAVFLREMNWEMGWVPPQAFSKFSLSYQPQDMLTAIKHVSFMPTWMNPQARRQIFPMMGTKENSKVE